jgi:hypothetical protein
MSRDISTDSCHNNQKAHNTAQHTPIHPSLSYPLGQGRDNLAKVELNSVVTKEKGKGKNLAYPKVNFMSMVGNLAM